MLTYTSHAYSITLVDPAHFYIFSEFFLTDWLNSAPTVMLSFGVLVLFLSFFALIAPNYMGLYGALILIGVPLFITWIYAILSMYVVYKNSNLIFINGFKWFNLPGSVAVSFDILLDKLSITYINLILSIGFCVLIYSFSYFRYEPHVERLFTFITLFMISMCILVMSGNLIVLFFGWELIGLTSFFLINFWSTKVSSLKAAFKAFVFNKLSDLGLLFFIILVLGTIGELNIVNLNLTFVNFIDLKINFLGMNISYLETLAFFLMTAIFVKSAQFGLHIWLPDSMEAPVPASALIHSATLVSAGVFLLLRFPSLFELTTTTTAWILIVSSVTTSFGAICACFQSDVKRILAYSTISHCGFLVFLSCISTLEVVLLYLCVHGFFKAIVFMCIGNVIRFARNYQDFRYMGGFSRYLPFETAITFVGLVNLGGLPFSFGLLIKHHLLLTLFDLSNIFIKINLIIGMSASLIYSYRLYYYIFFDTKKAKKAIYLTSSKPNLRSSLYTNSSLASNFAIILLLFVATIFIACFYNTFFLFSEPLSVYNNNLFNKNNYLNTTHLQSTTAAFFINFLILIVGLILIVVKYRYNLYYYHSLVKINNIIIVSFTIYFILFFVQYLNL